MTFTTAHRSGEAKPPFNLSAAAWELWELAACGGGMVQIAARVYGSDNWSLCGVVFHECGHAAAARAMGEQAWIKIDSPLSGACYRSGGQFQRQHELRMFALAGSTAECLAKYGLWQPDRDVQRWVTPEIMSTADRIQAGSFTGADVASCAALVRRNWASIREESAEILARELARWGAQTC
jgi:hypothetical protein